jgi:hypothetical protein
LIISVENIGKKYRLGEYNLRSALGDIKRKLSGTKTETLDNDRTVTGGREVWALKEQRLSAAMSLRPAA